MKNKIVIGFLSLILLMPLSSCREKYTDFGDCIRKKMNGFGVKRNIKQECAALFPPLKQNKLLEAPPRPTK